MGTDGFRAMHDIRHSLETLLEKLSNNLKNEPEVQFLRAIACVATMDIVQLVYWPDERMVQGLCLAAMAAPSLR